MMVDIKEIKKLSVIKLKLLIKDSQNQGCTFVQLLVDEWLAGTNCFNKKGEVLLVAQDNNQPIGLCGLNIDPYYPIVGLGRVRHLYVLSSKRRQGIGSQLLKEIIHQAKKNFDLLNLRTNNPEASLFYLAQGFLRSYERPECTHILKLNNRKV